MNPRLSLSRRLSLILITTVLLPPALAVAGPQDSPALAAIAVAEDDFLLQFARGKEMESLDSALAALSKTCDFTRNSALQSASEAAAAHAVFQLNFIFDAARETTRFAAVYTKLASINRAGLPPELATRLDFLCANFANRTGDSDRAIEYTKRQGFISDWLLIGPFDNERGGGFSRQEEPEKGFAPDLVTKGKERDVRWRTLPVAVPVLGILELKELMRPDTQAACYLRTTVTVKSDAELLLHVSSAEAVRVWVNGKLTFEKNLRRKFGYEQDIVPIRLIEGGNELLVKVCTQEENWSFSARLTDREFKPFTNGAWNAQAVLPARGAETDISAALAPVVAPSIAYFAARAGLDAPEAASPEGSRAAASAPATTGKTPVSAARAAAAFRLAWLLRNRAAEDLTAHADREAAKIAVEGGPNNVLYSLMLARTLEQNTNIAEERELNPSRKEYERSLALDSDHYKAALALANHYTKNLPIETEARKWQERAARISPSAFADKMLRVDALRRADLPAEARRLLGELDALPHASEHAPIQLYMATVEMERQNYKAAEDRLRRVIAIDRRSAKAALDSLASILKAQGRLDEWSRLVDDAARAFPFASWPHVEKARIALARGDRAGVDAAMNTAISMCPDEASIHAQHAHALVLLNDIPSATRALERTVAINPKDRATRRYLEYLQSSVKPFEDAFAVSATEFLKNPPPSAAGADEPYEVLLSQVAYKLNPDGTTQRYEHTIIKILNEEGAKRLDSYGVSHDPGEEQVRIKKALVIRKDGKVDNAPTSPGSSWVRFPTVAPGDIIALEARVDTVVVGVFGNYFGTRHLFHQLGLATTLRAEQIYVAPSDRKLYFNRRNNAPVPVVSEDPEKKLTTYTFRMENLKRPNIEAGMPDATEFAPSVSVSTYGTWEEFAAWWWNLIKKECESSPAIRDKVAELVKGKTTEEEKIRAIYDFVVTDIRYNAWEFGVHGYRPYHASTIFDRRYGDCKDKAILIKTMLSEIGIEAHPVLIYAEENRPKEDLTLPMVGLFNHCIAYVPAKDNRAAMFLDGTATHHPMGVLPEMDHGATVVIVKEGTPITETVVYPPASTNVERSEVTLELAADGSARGTVVLRPTGNMDVQVRQFFANEKGAQSENMERMLSSRFGRTKVTEIQTSNLSNLGEPVMVRATVEIEKFGKSRGDGIAIEVTTDPMDLLRVASTATREYDLLLGSPRSSEETLQIKLAQGQRASDIPKNDSRTTDFGTYSIETRQNGDTIVIESKASLLQHRVPPTAYGSFRDFARSLDEAQAREFIVRSN